ncbi:MAG: FkbM family methyltransferase, partial [Okeania sp. SIO2F5]|nr:FkbM family methyltransferase [Okeania sp. SIO2F5]
FFTQSLPFSLTEINLIIFPDWSQPEETVGLELQAVIKNLVTHPDRGKMTLLIDNSNISAEDADLILSSVVVNLLMESELEVDERPEIVLVGELSQIQWSALIPQLQGWIKLENENGEAIAQVKADNIPLIELSNLSDKTSNKID